MLFGLRPEGCKSMEFKLEVIHSLIPLISFKAVFKYTHYYYQLLSLHRYRLMSRCWMTESSERPTFCEISQQLSEILTENTTIYMYERILTYDMGDDYYMQPTDEDDKPIFCSEPDPDKLSTPE